MTQQAVETEAPQASPEIDASVEQLFGDDTASPEEGAPPETPTEDLEEGDLDEHSARYEHYESGLKALTPEQREAVRRTRADREAAIHLAYAEDETAWKAENAKVVQQVNAAGQVFSDAVKAINALAQREGITSQQMVAQLPPALREALDAYRPVRIAAEVEQAIESREKDISAQAFFQGAHEVVFRSMKALDLPASVRKEITDLFNYGKNPIKENEEWRPMKAMLIMRDALIGKGVKRADEALDKAQKALDRDGKGPVDASGGGSGGRGYRNLNEAEADHAAGKIDNARMQQIKASGLKYAGE